MCCVSFSMKVSAQNWQKTKKTTLLKKNSPKTCFWLFPVGTTQPKKLLKKMFSFTSTSSKKRWIPLQLFQRNLPIIKLYEQSLNLLPFKKEIIPLSEIWKRKSSLSVPFQIRCQDPDAQEKFFLVVENVLTGGLTKISSFWKVSFCPVLCGSGGILTMSISVSIVSRSC